MEGVLGHPKVRERLDRLCVGLAAHADPPKREQDLLIYLTPYMKDAKSLPYGVFLTHDRQFVRGFSDTRTLAQFLEDLDVVEKHPLRPATTEHAKRVADAAGKAEKLAEGEKWADVMKLVRAADAWPGRCDGRERLDEVLQTVKDHVAAKFDWVEESLHAGELVRPLLSELKLLAKLMKGEPEAETATQGLDAVKAFAVMSKRKGAALETARTKAAETFAGTRWAALFESK